MSETSNKNAIVGILDLVSVPAILLSLNDKVVLASNKLDSSPTLKEFAEAETFDVSDLSFTFGNTVHVEVSISCETKVLRQSESSSTGMSLRKINNDLALLIEKGPTTNSSLELDKQKIDQDSERQLMVGRLLGGMIHDFKNLLAGIQNVLEWCIANSAPEDQVNKALIKTISYTEQANSLIVGALRVCSNSGDSENEIIDVADAVHDLTDMIRRSVPASIELEYDIEPGLPKIFGERRMLQDLILNLCMNARDAMRDKGSSLKIEISAGDIHKGEFRPCIHLKVIDDGCGMSDEEVKDIFNAFHSTKSDGGGMGLWMVKESVNSFSGDIKVFSEDGAGTVFEICFPAHIHSDDRDLIDDEPAMKEPLLPEDSKILLNAEGKTVLFIEDDPLISCGVSSWLESWGFQLHAVEDGLAAWRLFQSYKSEIDIIIQDLVLPGKSGEELLELFTESNPNLPVIVSSGSTDESKIEQIMTKGAYAFLPKPFKMEELFALLKKITDSEI